MDASNGAPTSKAGDWRAYQRVLLPPVKDLHQLAVYEAHGGYRALRAVLTDPRWEPKSVNWLGCPPSAGTSQMPRRPWDAYAIQRPSGDHSGWKFCAPSEVKAISWDPEPSSLT